MPDEKNRVHRNPVRRSCVGTGLHNPAANGSSTGRSYTMAPDTKPGHGAKPKSPEKKKPTPAVKPDLTKKPGAFGAPTKPSGTKKR
jgi:hypothetical protein